jgi:rubrerythrin
MNQQPVAGDNRTGIVRAKERGEAMREGTDPFPPSSHGTRAGAGKIRVLYAQEGIRTGSVPSPVGIGGTTRAALEALKGDRPTLLMDKIGERIAFERTGTRLYEALLSKHEAFGPVDGGPDREELEEILLEEHRHFDMLTEVMRDFGGDPTAMTPSAGLVGVVSEGVLKVLTDPRFPLLDSLQAMLMAELADRASWRLLVELVQGIGENELGRRFEEAEVREEQHVERIRAWVRAGLGVT